jgi:hypothetical protein
VGREAATVSLGTKSRRRKITCAALLRVMTAERRKLLQAAREEMLSAVLRCRDSRFFRYFWS